MGFYADPDAIDVLACRVAEWGEDCDLARDYTTGTRAART